MLNFRHKPEDRICELGGGERPYVHPACLGGKDLNVDVRICSNQEGKQCVDFEANFNDPLPISSEEWDGVLSVFCLEHISWRKTSQFLSEIYRILKPGGYTTLIIPNTEAQMRHILNKPEFDDDEGSMIFGDQNHVGNFHCQAFSPTSITKKLSQVGFVDVTITPFGALGTDMVVECKKPALSPSFIQAADIEASTPITAGSNLPALSPAQNAPNALQPIETPPVGQTPTPTYQAVSKPAREVYTRKYFENYAGGGFLWDYPTNECIARKLLSTYSPSSVLELGCARGYVLKKLQDRGLRVQGVDVSKHAWMTRACDPILVHDLTETPWPLGKQEFDLAFSFNFLEHIPEEKLEAFVEELTRVSSRGVHAITFAGAPANPDAARCTLKPKEWWKKILPETHEVVEPAELTGDGSLPEDYVKGDGKLKLNIGSAWTMFHQGWQNLDTIDGANFAQAFGYNFLRHDVTQGLPYSTGTVDLIFAHHFLEHLSYQEGLKFLRECRRVIRKDGAMRIVVPDFQTEINERDLDEINAGAAEVVPSTQKKWAVLGEGHRSFHDYATLSNLLEQAGWRHFPSQFRTPNDYDLFRIAPSSLVHEGLAQILRETTENEYGGLSLFVNALPSVG